MLAGDYVAVRLTNLIPIWRNYIRRNMNINISRHNDSDLIKLLLLGDDTGLLYFDTNDTVDLIHMCNLETNYIDFIEEELKLGYNHYNPVKVVGDLVLYKRVEQWK